MKFYNISFNLKILIYIDISLVYDKAIRISNNLYGNQFPE